ncbi:MAG: glycosyltransferase family 2 protein, partial [Flavobacteriales bacterium]|nr:glycosyltransferase family 2 protein [Flavobacteriales bacterium]
MKYYIITPAKNEEQYIRLTLESMVKQTVKPEKWIIVNDGSTDRTLEIAEEYAAKHPWIQIISLDNKGEQRSYGSKVIRAFNAGYRLITDNDYGFIVKLDADLSFPETYFQQIGEAFDADPKLGLCGGYVLERPDEYEIKKTRFPRVEGALKSVRKACFDDIGGFVEENGWDGLDILMALHKGWEMRNIDVKVTHHRPETSAYRST